MPFRYLWFIGVNPELQGKGLGSALFQEIEAQNKTQLPTYLETSTETNLPFYQKLGFEVYREVDLGYRLYMMGKVG